MNPIQKRFAREHGMPSHEVARLVRLANQAHTCNEHASNGDPYYREKGPGVVGYIHVADKNECARFWSAKLDETTEMIRRLVTPYGFTDVVYTGLGPTLKKGETFVEVPY